MLSVAEIERKAQRLWPRVLAAGIAAQSLFPYEIPLAPPKNYQLADQFANLRRWILSLETFAGRHDLQIRHREVNHRILGHQRLPAKVVIPHRASFLSLVGRCDDYERFLRNAALSRRHVPALDPYLPGLIKELDSHALEWPRLMEVVRHFIDSPRPNRYLRELDIAGVDSKFIESHRRVLGLLLDRVLADEWVQREADGRDLAGFCRRFGLKYDPPLIRFRWLDPSLARRTLGLTDLSVPVEQFAAANAEIGTVFITENKVNGLSFPSVDGAMVIFGLGYGVDLLSRVPWLRGKVIYYWGDIDTHGLHILHRLRQAFPHAVSMLMDEGTLLANREFWGQEPVNSRYRGPLCNLTKYEQALYQDLLHNRHGENIRVEQERIPFQTLRDHLEAL